MSSSALCRESLAAAPAQPPLTIAALWTELQRFGDWAQSSLDLREGAFVSELDPDLTETERRPA